jgi:hypothetical protein
LHQWHRWRDDQCYSIKFCLELLETPKFQNNCHCLSFFDGVVEKFISPCTTGNHTVPFSGTGTGNGSLDQFMI